MIKAKSGTLEAINDCKIGWFNFVNRDMSDTDFSTDILAYIAADAEELTALKSGAEELSATEAIEKEKIKSEEVLIDYLPEVQSDSAYTASSYDLLNAVKK